MQSLAAETDFCAPEKQKQIISVSDWKGEHSVYAHIGTSQHTLPPTPGVAEAENDTLWSAASGNQSAAACKVGQRLGPS